MSHLTDFYRGRAPDSQGRRIEEIWAWVDADVKMIHDFMQWLFPLPLLNPHAPVLTPGDIASFRSDEAMRANLRKSFDRILSFLGLTMTSSGEVVEGSNFPDRSAVVWAARNRDWLGVTRVLRSLTLLGLETEAGALYRWLDARYASRRFPITAETFRYWTAAAPRHPAGLS